MKKIVLGIFLISNLNFINWKTINLVDKIGKVAIFSYLKHSEKGYIPDGDEYIIIYSDYYYSEKE